MDLLKFFRSGRNTGTASVAKERLQILVAHERGNRGRTPEYLPAMKRELLEVVRKYVPISQDQIKVHLDKEGDCEVLELNIMLTDEDTGTKS